MWHILTKITINNVLLRALKVLKKNFDKDELSGFEFEWQVNRSLI